MTPRCVHCVLCTEERARAPIHLRGRLPEPPPKKEASFTGDYGLLPKKAKKAEPFGKPKASALRQASASSTTASSKPASVAAAPVSKAAAAADKPRDWPDEGAVTAAIKSPPQPVIEKKKRGAVEEDAPRPGGHAGEEAQIHARLALQPNAPLLTPVALNTPVAPP